jgi:ribonuclease R
MAQNKNNKRINAKAPSRQDIIKLLGEQRRPVQRREIFERLKVISDDAREIMRRRLKAMLRDGQIVKNRRNAYGLPEKMDLVRGRISAHPDGFGFVVPETGDSDLYLSSREMRRVLHGDKVLAAVTGIDHRGRREGVITEILERAHERIVGRFVRESGVALIVPDERRINQDVLIPLSETGKAKPGQVVVAEITQQPGPRQPPVGRIVEILGETGAPGMATEIAIRNLGLPHEWPKGVEEEAAAFGEEVDEGWKAGRRDLRELPLVTIDGADARDFDDAVFAQRHRNSWRLVVAIADVASYVRPGSKLDAEARERATSVYFPGRVIPMLPEQLSNGLCSLNPDVDRLCLVCDMSIDNMGRVTRSRFDTAVMRSQARLTYKEVWDWLVSGDKEIRPGMDKVSASLRDLYGLYKALRKARTRRGAIDFESTEVKFVFDQHGAVDDIRPVERNDAHKIIEECMVTANVQAARLLLRQEVPTLFRVHEPPQGDRVESLEQFLRGLGIKVTWRGRPEPRHFEQIVQQVKGRDDQHLIMAVLLRAQSLATYQANNHGHFGLALEAYSHFTSPIRRYPDLLVHRALHHLQKKKDAANFFYSPTEMNALAEHCSHRSRRAEEAERDVSERLKCFYMERHVGDRFNGRVSGVTSFGLFVELDRIAVSGLVHITALPNDHKH